jgi:hypothetical protein
VCLGWGEERFPRGLRVTGVGVHSSQGTESGKTGGSMSYLLWTGSWQVPGISPLLPEFSICQGVVMFICYAWSFLSAFVILQDAQPVSVD